MTPVLIGLLIGALLSTGVICVILMPKVKQTQKLDEEIIEKNNSAKLELESLINQDNLIRREIEKLNNESTNLIERIDLQKSKAKNDVDEYLRINKENADLQYQQYEQDLKSKYDQARQDYCKEYIATLDEFTKRFISESGDMNLHIDELNKLIQQSTDELNDLRSRVSAAVEANKRAAEMENKRDFYRLNLSKEDIEEIERLRSVIPYLREAESLNKVIWKVYYEKPCTDMIGRVVGSGVHCGIYKITNLQNNMCYVGQAVNIANRWKQHIKRGIGAETPTRNKLYPVMQEVGVENFSFEIIEECPGDKLNEREDYWQEFFKAKEFGYSIK